MKNKFIPNKILIVPSQIICADNQDRILKNHVIEIVDGIITRLVKYDVRLIQNYGGEIVYAEGKTLIPGFIQTHVHLCQTLFRGLADDLQLLDWLQLKIFPFENAHDKKSLSASVKIGLDELTRSGTTTILDMGTLRNQEVIFDELISAGVRAFAGKCMIDQNSLFPRFKSSTKIELEESYNLAENFHNTNKGLIHYGFAPRFVLSCSEKMLKLTKEMMADFPGSIYHSHSSENKIEVQEVRKRTGKENIEYFNSINVLGNNTVLAHCIHLNQKEIKLLKKTKTKICHCPSSNLKLGSGIANIPKFLKEGITVSLGADGAPCNNSLSQFTEMRLAALIQKPIHGPTSMDAKTVFKLATIEGAKTLNIDNEVGSIEVGKKADLVLLNLNSTSQPLSDLDENIYSKIVYSASKENVSDVMINGCWIVRNKHSIIYDEDELLAEGQKELKSLLNRT
jgi:cytosine/adenosine deaminase-related metal-dependent hydrolase